MTLDDRPERIKRYAPFIPGIPQPATDWNEPPLVCVTFAESWVPMILGALEVLRWKDLFSGRRDLAEHYANQVQSLMDAIASGNLNCAEEDMPILRQNSYDPCILEQSQDNGLTWQVAFNFRLCLGAYGQPTADQIYIQMDTYNTWIDNSINTWNGDINNIAPNATMDGGANDDIRNQTMCYAISYLVASIGKAIAEQEATGGVNWRDVALLTAVATIAFGDLAIGLAGAGLITLSTPVIIGTTVAVALTGFALQFLPEGEDPVILSIITPDVQEKLVCCATAVLGGNTPTVGLFATIFDSCDIPGITDDTMEFLQHMVDQEETYVSFLEVINKAYDAIDAGQEFQCPDCEEWEEVWNVGTELDEWTVVETNSGIRIGNQWNGSNYDHPTNEEDSRGVWLEYDFAATEITHIGYDFIMAAASSGGLDCLSIGSTSGGIDSHVTFDNAPTGTGDIEWDGSEVIDNIRLHARSSVAIPPAGSCSIITITVRGKGLNPFS